MCEKPFSDDFFCITFWIQSFCIVLLLTGTLHFCWSSHYFCWCHPCQRLTWVVIDCTKKQIFVALTFCAYVLFSLSLDCVSALHMCTLLAWNFFSPVIDLTGKKVVPPIKCRSTKASNIPVFSARPLRSYGNICSTISQFSCIDHCFQETCQRPRPVGIELWTRNFQFQFIFQCNFISLHGIFSSSACWVAQKSFFLTLFKNGCRFCFVMNFFQIVSLEP